MNLRYQIGSAFNVLSQGLLSSSHFPLTRYIPRGNFWLYDACRFAGTRDFSVLFDVGANTGQTAYGFVRYFPRATTYCFEPVGETYEILRARYGTYPSVNCVRAALGAKPGTVSFALREDSELNSLAAADNAVGLTGEMETTAMTTVDGFCASEGLSHIDILKMDVQGWEMEVLKGATRMLGAGKIQFVFAEVSFHKEGGEMQSFCPLNDYLDALGFRLCGFYDTFRWGHNKGFIGFSNALYINPKFDESLTK